jgi:hypothetical protein
MEAGGDGVNEVAEVVAAVVVTVVVESASVRTTLSAAWRRR